MTKMDNVSRRGFLAGAGAAGLVLGFRVPLGGGGGAALAGAGHTDELSAWVMVRPDEQVVIRIARSEMGQGTLTGLAQLVAEELECDWSRVTTEYVSPTANLKRFGVWKSFQTTGSRGIRTSHDYVREGGAAARDMLIAAAAKGWGVNASECRAAKGVITHGPSGKTTTFGKVAAAAAKLPVPEKVKLKDPKDWTIAGKPMKRLDTADKLTGKQVFGIDVKLPGMVNAAIRQYPLFGAKLKSFDASKAQSMSGVKKVLAVGGNAVAVVADTWWQAKTALDAVDIQWDDGPHAKIDSADIAAMVREGLDAKDAFVGNKVGDAKAAIAKSPKRIEATYSYPFQHHATMEPMNATAVWTPEKCEVWCPTQSAESALQVVAKAAGLDPSFCTIHRMHLGGGFGRRGAGPIHDYATQAVEIAKAMPGTPVKLLWSREEDMTHGAYHPVTQCRLSAGLDENGDITGLHVRISGQSILAGIMPGRLKNGMDIVTFQCLLPKGDHAISYDFPNLLVDHAMRNPHLRPGFWRGVNANHNVIYLESFMDELAKAAGQDPLAFRLKYMAKYPKNQAVLKAVAEKAGWGTPAPKGVFRGLAHCKAFASYVAACAEVSVSDGGMVKIHRIVAATDTGHAVNPQQIEAQVEGSFVYGLSAMLMGECTVKAGRVEQQNFDRYEVMRIKDMPKVETTVMPSGGFWGGVGEPTIAVAAPAVLNAIAAATGKRIRDFPMKHAGLRTA